MLSEKEKKNFYSKYFDYDDSLMLYRTQKISDINNENAVDLINFTLSLNDHFSNCMASVINAIFTQKTSVFSFTRDSIKELIKQDINHDMDAFQNSAYTNFKRRIINTQFVEENIPQSGRQPGLYRLKDVTTRSILVEMIGERHLQEQEKIREKEYFRFLKKVDHKGNLDSDVAYYQKLKELHEKNKGKK